MNITVEKIKRSLEKDYGWSNLDDYDWFFKELISDTIKVIDNELIKNKGISIKNTNPKILKVGEVVNIGGYEFSVNEVSLRKAFFLESKEYEDTFKLFEKFGITNKDIHSKFETAEDKDVIFPETKTLKELTKIYYYLKTFEV